MPSVIRRGTATAGQDTPVGAVAAAEQLPDHLGRALLWAARQAFTQGLHVAFAISAAAVIGAAILAAILLRHPRPSAEPGWTRPGRDTAN